MRYAFRLAELLGHTPDRRKRPGTIKAIVEHTGLDRHQVASLLKNEAKYIPLDALSRLCDYLIDQGHATADQLPGALFAVNAENFWEQLARRSDIEIVVGVRQAEGSDSPENAMVVASDSVLVGELLNGISTLGGVAKHIGEGSESSSAASVPMPDRIQQSLVWSPGQVTLEDARARATEVFEGFTDAQGDRGIVCIGSVKSNPAVELLFSDAFGCTPFVTEDDVDDVSARSCPFFLRYRDNDPKPGAASAGMRLSKNLDAPEPGFYYEKDDGTWEYAGGQGKDTALVFYLFYEALGRLDMVLSGFSGRATRLLAKTLAIRGEEFWPPVYHESGVQVGAFLVQYDDAESKPSRDDLLYNTGGAAKIMPLSREAIARRMARR
ncbi:helix-turn-helix transcriptional regulator [Rhodopirellula sp. JC740]|uniref:Helix-turn-helix transcriptional regulator n=1 Tax=Rhodopirellula halodulae TaxID=2894198 RepID=A0ABS8NE42_9BACT|nr:helix-turn-helix transcriptional regulator [Rhodopirellula sp. JC740]MCC9641825.1 helix-turn-helix transcriptional regulator [Rhodopirellula sp. JC740]